MKKKILGFLTLSLCTVLNVSAKETFKVVFYNLSNYPPETAVSNRKAGLERLRSDDRPEVFLVCEWNSVTGATNVLDITRTSINPNFEMATYASNTSDDTGSNQYDLQHLWYCDPTKFRLEGEISAPTALRDLNINTALESVFQELLDSSGAITFSHIYGRSDLWNNGLPDGYHNAINASACGIFNSQCSFTLRNTLHNFSDHLPVTLSLETDATLGLLETAKVADAFYLEKRIIHDDIILCVNAFEASGVLNGLYLIGPKTAHVAPLKIIISN